MNLPELSIWKSDWGLPSVDIECLCVLAYTKFNDIPVKVITSNNPFKTPNGRLPVLRTETGTLDTAKDIIEYFRERNYNSEFELSRNQCALVVAYDALLREKLYPAIQFVWWIDNKNVHELIRPWYYRAVPFPLSFYYPGKFERQARDMFETLYPPEDDINAIESKVYSEAQKCLTLLSVRLGESKYFFGQVPTVLDAIVYSYLAPLLKAPLVNSALQNHLKACTNLVSYVLQISETYFENEYREYKLKENAQNISKYSENDFPNKTRNQVLAGCFATMAMIAYVLSTGILEISVTDRHIFELPTEDTATDDE